MQERRAAGRLRLRESLFIQLLLPCLNDVCPSRVVDSVTVDVSKTGLRILLPEAVEAERLFDICVELRASPKRFLLTGETRWCRYDEEEHGYEVGIEIQDGEGTDFDAWTAFFNDASGGQANTA